MTFDEIIGLDPEPDFSMLAKDAFENLNKPPPPPLPSPSPSGLPSPPVESGQPGGGSLGRGVMNYYKSFFPSGFMTEDMNQEVDLKNVPFPTGISPSQEMLGLTGTRPMPMETSVMRDSPGVKEIMDLPAGQEKTDRLVAMGMDLAGASRGFWRGGTGIPKTVMKEIWRDPAREIAGASKAMRNSPSGSATMYERLPPRRGTDYRDSLRKAIDERDIWGARNIMSNAHRDDISIRLDASDIHKMTPDMLQDYMRHQLDRVGADIKRLLGPTSKDFPSEPYPWEEP